MLSIKTFAPFLVDDFLELDEPIFDVDQYSVFLQNNTDRLGGFEKHLICKLHDSQIIDIKHDIGSFKITLNEFSTYVFACAVIKKYYLSIDMNQISFPMTIEFEGDIQAVYYKVEDNGDLKQIRPTQLDEYLYEQITHIDPEKIEIVFHFWKNNLINDKPGESILLVVSANKLDVIENQDHFWKEVFGTGFDELYSYFKEQFAIGRYASGQSDFFALIDKYQRDQLKSN